LGLAEQVVQIESLVVVALVVFALAQEVEQEVEREQRTTTIHVVYRP
jgi:hypothetical protein